MIDCHRCRHYYVTWDKRLPHGCRAMGFKSAQLPAVAVRVNSRRDCLMYQPKNRVEPDPDRFKS